MNTYTKQVLFFTASAVPTTDELATAAAIGLAVSFRNAELVGAGERVEDCEFVAGAVPAAYAHFPVHPAATGGSVIADDKGSDPVTTGTPPQPAPVGSDTGSWAPNPNPAANWTPNA